LTDNISLIIHKNKWNICVLHALATHAALMISPSDTVFPSFFRQSHSGSIINQELKLIENKFLLDEDINKPKKYKTGLLTHSIRSGATNVMNEIHELKSEWVDIRCGRTSKNLVKNTKSAYIKSEWSTDYPCGLVLSGWDNIKAVGKCPNKSSIPIIDHKLFSQFIFNIFSGIISQVSENICNMLGCVLLKWHITIENEFPYHPIVTKVNKILNKDKILQWNRCVEETFKVDNQMFLPLSEIHEETFASAINIQNTYLLKNQQSLNYISSQLNTQEKFNSAVTNTFYITNEKIDELNLKIDNLICSLNTNNNNISKNINNNNNNIFKKHQHMQQQTITSTQQPVQSTSSHINSIVKISEKSNAVINNSILQFKDLQSVFYTWYKNDLFKYEPCINNSDEKSKFRKLSKVIIYMKLFLPLDCKLLSVKNSVEESSIIYTKWMSDLQSTSKALQESVMKFIKISNIKNNKKLSDIVYNKANLWSAFKMLESIPVSDFPINENVIDNITIPSTYIYSSNKLIEFRKA